jgi:transcriptional regulator with XRE-family HTH domain
MNNNIVNVKKLREALGLKQAELAAVLCVTQATVARWESESGATEPTGDAARRLCQLQTMTAIPEENKVLTEMLGATGGVSAVAALLSLGTSMNAAALVLPGVGALFGPLGIAGGAAAALLTNFFIKHTTKTTNERRT